MNHVFRFKKFFEQDESERKRIIHSIIDEEVKISHDKFKLEIDEKDLEMEKEKISDAILMIWDDIESANNREYNELMTFVFSGVEKILPIEKYFNMGKKDYKVHISCVIYKIFMVINNKLYDKY